VSSPACAAWTGAVDVEVDLEVPDDLQGTEDVAVPEEPLEPLELAPRLAPGLVLQALAIWFITVRRMVTWNQSIRCSASGLR
jgi:hypothetical protein